MENLSITEMTYPKLKTQRRLDCKGIDFLFWRRQLDFVFFDNNVEHVLKEPIPDKESDPVAHQKFLDDDMKARHIILGSIDDKLLLSQLHHETAKCLLDALTTLSAKPSMAKQMSLLKRYVDHKMGEGRATSENKHVLEMSSMALDLKFEGIEVPGDLQAVVLMNSLPDSWHDTVTIMTTNMDGDEEKMKLAHVEDRVRVRTMRAYGCF